MINIEEARRLVAEQSVRFNSEWINVPESIDRTLAKTIASPLDLPLFDNSAMDGYAVSGEYESYGIVGEVAAGQSADFKLNDGEAVRIFTGAPLPQGTTSIVIQEVVEVKGNSIQLQQPTVLSANIRRRGDELRKESKIFDAGYVLNAAGVGLLCALGIKEVQVYSRPKVGILVTGNELIAVGETLQPGQIYESNSATLKSACWELGITEVVIHRVHDGLEATTNSIDELLGSVDVLLVSGGISVGDYDFVKESLEKLGVEEVFYKVSQKPGKPLYFGKGDRKFVFALPGNPASSLNCFYVYVSSLLCRMMGKEESNPVKATLGHDQIVKGTRPTFFRSTMEGNQVDIKVGQSSSMLHSFALGNALTLLQPGENMAGTEVLAWRY